jgi:hypothetical protein
MLAHKDSGKNLGCPFFTPTADWSHENGRAYFALEISRISKSPLSRA